MEEKGEAKEEVVSFWFLYRFYFYVFWLLIVFFLRVRVEGPFCFLLCFVILIEEIKSYEK